MKIPSTDFARAAQLELTHLRARSPQDTIAEFLELHGSLRDELARTEAVFGEERRRDLAGLQKKAALLRCDTVDDLYVSLVQLEQRLDALPGSAA